MTVRRAALLAALAAVAMLLLAPTNASAQITPVNTASDYCDDWSPAKNFGPTPRGFFNITVSPAGGGTVAAEMFGTVAKECLLVTDPKTCPPTCRMQAQAICEFHCSHNHIAPYPWTVQFRARPAAGWHFVGWQANCEANANADRRDCILRWTNSQTEVNLTAVFATAPDSVPPTAPRLSATAQTYAANLSWTPSTDAWLAGYDVFRGAQRVARVARTATSHTLRSLLCNTAYTLRIEAFDYSGNSTSSNEVSVTTGACTSGGATGARPNTEIHVKPRKVTRKKRAFFHFGHRGEVRATKFQCKLDKRRWKRCSARNGITYRRLKPGKHVFRVRAGNANGWDRTPARYRWRVRR